MDGSDVILYFAFAKPGLGGVGACLWLFRDALLVVVGTQTPTRVKESNLIGNLSKPMVCITVNTGAAQIYCFSNEQSFTRFVTDDMYYSEYERCSDLLFHS